MVSGHRCCLIYTVNRILECRSYSFRTVFFTLRTNCRHLVPNSWNQGLGPKLNTFHVEFEKHGFGMAPLDPYRPAWV